jgi:hypothetical protein
MPKVRHKFAIKSDDGVYRLQIIYERISVIRDRETIKAKFTQDELADLIITILRYRVLDEDHLKMIQSILNEVLGYES